MKRISARFLAQMDIQTLWDTLQGEFILVFDDGEMQVDAKTTLYSAFAWEFHRRFPNTPMLKKHHVLTLLAGGKRMGSNTHLQLLGNAMWSTYDTYVHQGKTLASAVIQSEKVEKVASGEYELVRKSVQVGELAFRDHLAELIYSITNVMYNELSYRLEEYAVSLDITDFLNLMDAPVIKQVNTELQAVDMPGLFEAQTKTGVSAKRVLEGMIENAYTTCLKVMDTDTSLDSNRVVQVYKAGLANSGQLLQSITARGFLSEIDDNRFVYPIMRGYVQGFNQLWESMVESRSAAKSLLFSSGPLEQVEYFSRRLQLMTQAVQNLHHCDCGTTKYMRWPVRGEKIEKGKKVRDSDLSYLAGKKYMDEDGVLKTVMTSDRHLIGKTLRMRAAIHCAHPDPYGICSTCFGDLSLSVLSMPVNDHTNIGQLCCTALAQQTAQAVLSTKHLDRSIDIKAIQLTAEMMLWLKVASDENSYLLADKLEGKHVQLIIISDQAQNIAEVKEVDDVGILNISRISEISEIGLRVVPKSGTPEGQMLNVSVDNRKASLTQTMLAYLKVNGWEIDEYGNFVVDLSQWDWADPILTLPLKHFNMSDHSRDIAAFLESSVQKLKDRDQNVSVDAMLMELFDLVNEKITVPVAVLDVVLYGSMVVSLDENNPDFSLPKPWTTAEHGVMKLSMAGRSIGQSMLYESHYNVITSPSSYIFTNRPEHPVDVLVMPHEVLSYRFNYRAQG